MKYWHGQQCEVLVRAPFLKGVKRNALIKLLDGKTIIVPYRSLRTTLRPIRE